MDKSIKKYLSEIGRKGGAKKSKKKASSSKINWEKAVKALKQQKTVG